MRTKKVKGTVITNKRGKQILNWFKKIQKEDEDTIKQGKKTLSIRPLINLSFSYNEIARFIKIDTDKNRFLINLENEYFIIDAKKDCVISYGKVFDFDPAPHYEDFVV